MPDVFQYFRWQDVVDILLVSFIIYRTILIIRGTRAVQMLIGIAVLIVIYFGARELELLTLYWLLRTLLSSIFLIIIIVFQHDIRRALTQVGKTPFYKAQDDIILTIRTVAAAAQYLSERRIGGLIVLERETGLREYIDSGHKIDAVVTKELLVSLFMPTSPLHDGGVVIHKDRIQTAGCLLPLSKNPYINKRFGTRHRAAIGLSEETDALIVVISEETKEISLVQDGKIETVANEKVLANQLETIFVPRDTQQQRWKNWFNKS
ncbi:MAG: TIGR00159 family protein [Deltaproteobacteria bacterium RIFOXYD12_FULL_57_12]|nr:MAG: TIGR00159 family protein [Deltaproteobacteria bacterium RIFOXYD12_FULL_57_12]